MTHDVSHLLDVTKIRSDFPILSMQVYGKPLVYLDNAASAQKPTVVIDAMADAMRHQYANVHRGLHWMSADSIIGPPFKSDLVQFDINGKF